MDISLFNALKLIQLIMPVTKIATQIVSNNLNSYVSSYFIYKPYQPSEKNDYEIELEKLQMDKLLKWMNVFFTIETDIKDEENEHLKNQINETGQTKITNDIKNDTKVEYFKELYSLYKNILSDFKQYEKWKKYNHSLFLFKSYRSYSTHELAKKIIYDVHLFNEGINLYCKLR